MFVFFFLYLFPMRVPVVSYHLLLNYGHYAQANSTSSCISFNVRVDVEVEGESKMLSLNVSKCYWCQLCNLIVLLTRPNMDAQCVYMLMWLCISKYEMYMYVNKPSIKMVVTLVLFLGEFLQLGKKKKRRESSKKFIIFFLTSS
jgi:hypothetical protein